jgi:hypothetical protein
VENTKLKNAYLIWPDMQIPQVGSIFAYRAQKIKSLILKKEEKIFPEMWYFIYLFIFILLCFLFIFITSPTPDDIKCP